jgi:PadR family transcriptional regulator PadR
MGTGTVRVTVTTQAVLRVLLDEPDRGHYGFDIGKKARIATGSLYPILDRLERAGWVTAAWEDIDPKEAGRPRRRYYQLTRRGQAQARGSIRATVERIVPTGWSKVDDQ